MSVTPILIGVVSSLLGVLQLAMWLAIGSFAIPRNLDDLTAFPAALLVGSGATAAIYAILAYAGHVDAAILVNGTIGCISLVLRAHWLENAVKALWFEFAPLMRNTASRVVGVTLCLLYWADAIVPPRDGDVMRYHLAHVRQIIRDGRWAPLPDYTYALPFGWTINYLPFERLRLAEASHVLNLGLWLLALVVLATLLLRSNAPRAAFLLLLFVALHPLVLKSATTAHVDIYSVFVVLVVVLFLIQLTSLNMGQMILFGIVSTVGVQSRLQLIGVSVVVLFVGLGYLGMGRISMRLFGGAIAGAILGLILASPFYVVNYVAFANPFWPLLVAKLNGLQLYADRVADNVNRSLSGVYTVSGFLHSFRALLTDPITFPIPLLALLSLSSPIWSRDRAVRVSALFGGLFVFVWAVVQPALYSRFILVLVPSLVIALGLSWRKMNTKKALNALICWGLTLASAAFFAFDLYYSKDSLRYVVTGDDATYHEATWFYPVYRWVNETAPDDARFLVIVASGHSYYLDRSYRRADPFLSGYIDWDAVTSYQQLRDILGCSHFDYVIYHLGAGIGQRGGQNLDAAIRSSINHNILRIVQSFNVRLITRRVSSEGDAATVWVLRRTPADSTSRCELLKVTQPFLD